jgi:hypothetical protein
VDRYYSTLKTTILRERLVLHCVEDEHIGTTNKKDLQHGSGGQGQDHGMDG